MISEIFNYITSAPFFWSTMAMTTASSLWIGALLYNGDFKLFVKSLFTLIPYVALLFATTVVRITNVEINNHAQAYAGVGTILFLTFFYVLGLLLGVLITKAAHKSKIKYGININKVS